MGRNKKKNADRQPEVEAVQVGKADESLATGSGRAPVDTLRLWFLPMLFYLSWFCLLTYPAILNFSTHYFADDGDGFQNVWNIWWVNEAITQLHTHPWYTHYLHYPHGTSLLAHTLNVFNGFLGIPLQWFLTLVQTHNVVVIFSFVVGGLTAFRLSLHLTGHLGGSLLAGWIFTFSNYHFAHAEGHLQLVSLEWIPLFVLMWWKLNEAPSVRFGVLAGVSLFLVLLCDYYYFLYCILIGALILLRAFLHHYQEHGNWRLWRNRQWLRSLLTFTGTTLVTSGPLILGLLLLSREGPMFGAHDPLASSLDLLAPFIPGGHWRFHSWTEGYWSQLPSNIHETSVHWGLSVCLLALIAWFARKRLALEGVGFWVFSLAFFTLMALGPRIHVAGQALQHLPGPYLVLEMLIPLLKLSGMPVRMSVMVYLSLGLLAGAGLSYLWETNRGPPRVIAVLLLGAMVFEYFPRPIPNTPSAVPEFIQRLSSLSPEYGLVDVERVYGRSESLHYQTTHRIPVFVGYISRTPYVVAEKNRAILQLMRRGDWEAVCEEVGFRYLLAKSKGLLVNVGGGHQIALPPLLSSGSLTVFDLQNDQTGWQCKPRSEAERSLW